MEEEALQCSTDGELLDLRVFALMVEMSEMGVIIRMEYR